MAHDTGALREPRMRASAGRCPITYGLKVCSVTRILILTGSALGSKMAGPAIRAVAMAQVLISDGHDVVLATTNKLDEGELRASLDLPAQLDVTVLRPGSRRGFARLERNTDVIVFQGHAMEQFPRLARSGKIVVADVYDPMHLEMLEQGREQGQEQWDFLVSSRVRILNQQLTRADYLLCASQRQRILYLGHLASLGRVSPTTYEDDSSLNRLLSVAPFGLDQEPPASTAAVLRGVVDGFDSDSKIVLWGGGLYSWFDPFVLIRAVHALHQEQPRARLVFLGTKTPGIAPMGVVKEAIDLARSIGALGTSVHFNDAWVPFNERGSFYVEADAGVSTHHVHLETEFSFRTRILDYLWAGLPIVVTEGDGFADLVEKHGLGVVVPEHDVDSLARALEAVLFDEAFAAQCVSNVEQLRPQFEWATTLMPLRRIAASPVHAADVAQAGGRARLARALRAAHKPPLPPGWFRDAVMTARYLRMAGPAEVWRRWKTRKPGSS